MYEQRLQRELLALAGGRGAKFLPAFLDNLAWMD